MRSPEAFNLQSNKKVEDKVGIKGQFFFIGSCENSNASDLLQTIPIARNYSKKNFLTKFNWGFRNKMDNQSLEW